MTSDQNAQLFINTCASLIAGVSNFTGCVYAGNNVHASGTNGANVVIEGPVIICAPGNNVNGTPFDLTCSSAPDPSGCNNAQANIVATFQAQGGTFPINVIKNQ